MKKQEDGLHPGITMHKIPVAGVGGLIFAVGIFVLALIGLPIAKWFLVGAVILGVGVVGVLRLFRKVHPQTEVEEVELNVGRQCDNRESVHGS
jgi:UDP-N-acetylmuramyl pentapeptide phosphotransferase/UDP-N-acetylglucosamine-1-phosphate transferase